MACLYGGGAGDARHNMGDATRKRNISVVSDSSESRRSSIDSMGISTKTSTSSASTTTTDKAHFIDLDISQEVGRPGLIAKLDDYRVTIESRTSEFVVKVPGVHVHDLSNYVYENWGDICELSSDRLIFKCPQSCRKGSIAGWLWYNLCEWGGDPNSSGQDAILRLGENVTRAPDVSFWSQVPTSEQRGQPLVFNCPPPNMWIEICHNDGKDFTDAMQKIELDVLPHCGGTCSVLAISLPRLVSDAVKALAGFYEPDGESVAAHALPARPADGFYVGYWPPGTAFQDAQWYSVRKNSYIDVAVPGKQVSFRFHFSGITKYL